MIMEEQPLDRLRKALTTRASRRAVLKAMSGAAIAKPLASWFAAHQTLQGALHDAGGGFGLLGAPVSGHIDGCGGRRSDLL